MLEPVWNKKWQGDLFPALYHIVLKRTVLCYITLGQIRTNYKLVKNKRKINPREKKFQAGRAEIKKRHTSVCHNYISLILVKCYSNLNEIQERVTLGQEFLVFNRMIENSVGLLIGRL